MCSNWAKSRSQLGIVIGDYLFENPIFMAKIEPLHDEFRKAKANLVLFNMFDSTYITSRLEHFFTFSRITDLSVIQH